MSYCLTFTTFATLVGVAACVDPDYQLDTNVIGVGLDAEVYASHVRCHEHIDGDECGRSILPVSAAASRDPRVAGITGLEDGHALVHGNEAGVATIDAVIASVDVDVSGTVFVQDIAYQTLVDCYPDARLMPCSPPAVFTHATRRVEGRYWGADDAGELRGVSGASPIRVESGTDAEVQSPRPQERAHILVTGDAPGVITLRDLVGTVGKMDVVSPSSIASITVEDDTSYPSLDANEIPLDQQTIVHVNALLDDGRKIQGQTRDLPTASSDSPQVEAYVGADSSFTRVDLRRVGIGTAHITLAWGGATLVLTATDPRHPEL